MKIESRGKYPGVKVHLDGEESKEFLKWAETYDKKELKPLNGPHTFAVKLGKKIKELLVEHPKALEERTEEEIVAALKRDQEKIEKQLAAGKGWKHVQ